MERIPLEGLNGLTKNLLARHGVTLELLQLLSRRDLAKIPTLGENSLKKIVTGLRSVEGIRLRYEGESIKGRAAKAFPDPRQIPASNLIFRDVLTSEQWYHELQLQLDLLDRYPTYADLTRRTCEDMCDTFGKKACRAIRRELAKYGLD